MNNELIFTRCFPSAVRLLRIHTLYSTIFFVLLIWELLSRWVLESPIVFPAPSVVLTAFMQMLMDGTIVQDLYSSISRILVGFGLGGILGVAFGIITGSSKLCYDTIGQIFRLLRSISVVALVPFSIVWFGFSEGGKYFLIGWGVFFIVWMNTHVGVSGVDKRFVWAATTLGMSRFRIIFEVLGMGALQTILAGLRTGIGVAMICVVAAEMGSTGVVHGLGYRVQFDYQLFEIDKMSATLLLIGFVGLLLDYIFVVLTRKLFPWILWNI